VKARELQPDGSYRRLKPEGKEPREQAQLQFRERSRRLTKKSGKPKRTTLVKLTPIRSIADAKKS
jgi:hypothetical protein